MQGWGINYAGVIRVTLFQQNFILRIAKKDQNRERKSSRYCEETLGGRRRGLQGQDCFHQHCILSNDKKSSN